jgi:DNA polymerase-3 subunit delta'
MNHHAANALLKTLEEPAPGMRLILVSHRPGRLAATIRSRCSKVSFDRPVRELALQWLASRNVANAPIALDEAGGAPFLAYDRQHDPDFVTAVRVVDGLLEDKTSSKMVDDLLEIPSERMIGLLQRRALDRLAYSLCDRGVYRAAPSELTEKTSALHLARWCQTLVADARVANHPLNQRLLYERILNSIPGPADN